MVRLAPLLGRTRARSARTDRTDAGNTDSVAPRLAGRQLRTMEDSKHRHVKSCTIFAETPERIDSHGTAHYSGVVLIFAPKGGTLAPEVALI